MVSRYSGYYICKIKARDYWYNPNHTSLKTQFELMGKVGSWTVYRASDGTVFAIYQKRLIIAFDVHLQQRVTTRQLLDHFRTSLPEMDKLRAQIREALGEDVTTIYAFPLLCAKTHTTTHIDKACSQIARSWSWLDEGITTFLYRVFDSKTNRVGYVRVSRHQILCAGLSDHIVQDVVNLTYEKFLYKMEEKGEESLSVEDVQSFLDGLSKYTIPTELNVSMSQLNIKMLIFVSFVTTSVAILSAYVFQERPTFPIVFALLGSFLLSLILAWCVLSLGGFFFGEEKPLERSPKRTRAWVLRVVSRVKRVVSGLHRWVT